PLDDAPPRRSQAEARDPTRPRLIFEEPAAQKADCGGVHGPGEAADPIEEEEVADPQAQHARADGRDGAPAGNETSDDEHGPASAGEHPLRRGEQTLPSGVGTPPVQPTAAAATD